MKAGRELDALIAEKVMGWEYHDWKTSTAFEYTKYCFICGRTKRLHAPVEIDDFCGTNEAPPHYSTQIADAWLVLESLDEWELKRTKYEKGKYLCKIAPYVGATWYLEVADTAPLAICLAALKAIE